MSANGVDSPISIPNGSFKLPSGTYALVYTGLNWGGPYQFKFTFNGETYWLEPDSIPAGGQTEGAIWNRGMDITFTV